MQFPIGKVLVSEGDSKPYDFELMAWIHLAEAIGYALFQLTQLLEEEDVRYFISPIIDIKDPSLVFPVKW